MLTVADSERQLLERLAAAGKATQLFSGEFKLARSLESADLVFLLRDGDPHDVGSAIITPKGRRLLAELEQKPRKPPKPPFPFHD
jgi:hypothetical protein